MKTIDNHTYSTTPFDNYKHRYKFEYKMLGIEYIQNVDIYSTCTNQLTVKKDISEHLKDKVTDLRLVHIASKEQDEANSKFLDEFLKTI